MFTRIMTKKREFDFAAYTKDSIEQLQSGSPILGEGGVFTPLLKYFLETALQAEMETHLTEEKIQEATNRRNGTMGKEVRTVAGKFDLQTPRDRAGTYQPRIVPKRQTIISDQLEQKVISMFGKGMSYSEISCHLNEIYGFEISDGELSSITDKVLPLFHAWQQRVLPSMYPVIWLDAMYYKVRVDGKVVTRVLYSVIGLNLEGKKEVLGIYLSESEGARFWTTILQDLKQRGVEDVLFFCVDGLKGFPEAIQSVFPMSFVQLCIVHMVRYAMRLIPDKDARAFVNDLKAIYQATDLRAAEYHLEQLQVNWKDKYPQSVGTWVNNWQHIATFFGYSEQIRRMIYTTNCIESYHRTVRKTTKSKGAFTSDGALLKLVYLTIQNLQKVWDRKTFSWKTILNELVLNFGDRVNNHLNLTH